MSGEILVVPKNAQGHLFPCMELCNHLLLRSPDFRITLLVDSDVTSSIPSSLLRSPLFTVLDLSSSLPPTPSPDELAPPPHRQQKGDVMTKGIEAVLDDPSRRPVCAIIDHIMYRSQEVFAKFGIPTVTFITSGACWAAVQHAVWAVQPGDMRPGEVRLLPGLPNGMVMSYLDLKQRRHWMSGPPHSGGAADGARGGGGGSGPAEAQGGVRPKMMGPPLPGDPAPWVEEVASSTAILVNTCDDLEGPFLDYMANLTGKPIWGVGPLLPDQYWQSSESLLRERGIRPKRESNYTDDQIVGWLDKQLPRSVILVSFGSEVGPSAEEYPELAGALEESARPFIWVIQRKGGTGYFPHGLDSRVGERGLVVHGWAPQLLILTHPSTGGFVSHCGWNSTVEAVVRGVPILAWPIRGDQYYNAKLVANYLRVGRMVSEGYPEQTLESRDIAEGIEKLLCDEEIRRRSMDLTGKFQKGFPESSVAALEHFIRDILS